MTAMDAYGRKAAAIVLRVLSGEKASSIEPVVMSDSPPMFDWRELKRWKIDESALHGEASSVSKKPPYGKSTDGGLSGRFRSFVSKPCSSRS